MSMSLNSEPPTVYDSNFEPSDDYADDYDSSDDYDSVYDSNFEPSDDYADDYDSSDDYDSVYDSNFEPSDDEFDSESVNLDLFESEGFQGEDELAQQIHDDFSSAINTVDSSDEFTENCACNKFSNNIETVIENYDNLANQAEMLIDDFDDYLYDNFNENYSIEQNYAIIDQFTPETEEFGFLKKIGRGIKNLGKKALKVVNKLNPIHHLMQRLKRIVRPFIKKIINKVLNKIPEPYRTQIKGVLNVLTKKVRRRFGRRRFGRRRFGRRRFGRRRFASDEFLNNYQDYEDFNEEYSNSENVQNLASQYIENMKRSNSSDQLIHSENFVTAVLAGLKIGIKIIGRNRVVKFLAKLLQKLISKLIRRKFPLSISKFIVDKGMAAISLYAPSNKSLNPVESIATKMIVDVGEQIDDSYSLNEDITQLSIQEAFNNSVTNLLTVD